MSDQANRPLPSPAGVRTIHEPVSALDAADCAALTDTWNSLAPGRRVSLIRSVLTILGRQSPGLNLPPDDDRAEDRLLQLIDRILQALSAPPPSAPGTPAGMESTLAVPAAASPPGVTAVLSDFGRRHAEWPRQPERLNALIESFETVMDRGTTLRLSTEQRISWRRLLTLCYAWTRSGDDARQLHWTETLAMLSLDATPVQVLLIGTHPLSGTFNAQVTLQGRWLLGVRVLDLDLSTPGSHAGEMSSQDALALILQVDDLRVLAVKPLGAVPAAPPGQEPGLSADLLPAPRVLTPGRVLLDWAATDLPPEQPAPRPSTVQIGRGAGLFAQGPDPRTDTATPDTPRVAPPTSGSPSGSVIGRIGGLFRKKG